MLSGFIFLDPKTSSFSSMITSSLYNTMITFASPAHIHVTSNGHLESSVTRIKRMLFEPKSAVSPSLSLMIFGIPVCVEFFAGAQLSAEKYITIMNRYFIRFMMLKIYKKRCKYLIIYAYCQSSIFLIKGPMQKYDYIITGTGASGLMLAYYMAIDPFFDSKKILLIDKEQKQNNDRTWCFWEQKNGTWNKLVSKKWESIYFGSEEFSKTMNISPYNYKLIRSQDFYRFVFAVLEKKENISFAQQEVISLNDEGSIVEVETNTQIYLGDKVFNSILLSEAHNDQERYPVLNQHFVGWFVKTKAPCFDDTTATFMDFTVAQKGNTRFMYVLPISTTKALLEYTLFSEDLLPQQEYEDEIKRYLKNAGISEYKITEKERGNIPMTCYPFYKQNTKNVLHMGTAGGWTKPSTGYTFNNADRKITKLVAFLKNTHNLSKFEKRTKYWWYDLLFLDLLYEENENGAVLFSRLFKKNNPQKILKFLDEETSFPEEVAIMRNMPARKFLKMFWKRIF